MINKKRYVIFVFIMFFCLINNVKANIKTGYVSCALTGNDVLYVRSSAGGSIITSLACGTSIDILNENAGTTTTCSKWYQVKYNANDTGYVCGEYINIDSEIEEVTSDKGYVSCVENDDPLTVREVVGGTIIDRLSCDTEMTIKEKGVGTSSWCDNWYYVSYLNDTKFGYVCGNYVYTKSAIEMTDDEVEDYKEILKDLGFPNSYLDNLVELHKKHPNWQFRTFKTNLDWDTVIKNENLLGRNLIYYTYGDGYRSTQSGSYNWETDTYYRHPTETNWWYASDNAIKYYMDPRNFLTEKYIFMFEALSYQPNFQNANLIKKIMDNSFMPSLYSNFFDNDYTTPFIDAANTYNISPVHLSSRILQEVGVNGSVSSSGEFTYDGTTYNNIFNFFNIRATGTNPAINGLIWAMGGLDGTGTSYGRPWNNPYKAIMGGAQFLSEDYIAIGQDTLYFQKFDVSRSSGRYTHQYMQNLTAPTTEGLKVYQSYAGISSLLNESLTFIIPVYNNMPSTAVSKVVDKNPNYYLKDIKINNKSIDNFTYNKSDYTITLEVGVTDAIVSATSISSKASVKGTGNITLNNLENKVSLVVTAENGKTFTYNLTLIKQENEEEIVLSNNSNLKSLSIKGYDINFNKDTLVYNLEVSNSISQVTINYELEDSTASVNTNNKVSLIVGLNKIEIKVTAEDKTTKTYTINITRKEMPLSEVLNNIGVKYNDTTMYGIKVNTSIESLISSVKKINNSTSVIVKDSNNNIKSSIFATGDKITISLNEIKNNYEVLIYGDITGDGIIDKLDALAILRQYYKYTSYNGVYKQASDVNKDGVIDKLDALAVLRDYYGYAKISQ